MKIKTAAIRINGKILTGKRHDDIIIEYIQSNYKDPLTNFEYGFITDSGEFVSRERAAEIAFESGQISMKVRRLLSEDIK